MLDTICEILAKSTDKKVLKDQVAAIFYAGQNAYPSAPKMVDKAAAWLIALGREKEWTGDIDPLIEKAFELYCMASAGAVELVGTPVDKKLWLAEAIRIGLPVNESEIAAMNEKIDFDKVTL